MRAFLQMLNELQEGRIADDASRALEEVRDRVVETGKPGVLTLTLTVKPATKGNRQVHSVVAKVASKLPAGEAEESLLYVQEDGLYSRRDPRQPELPAMRDVTREFPEASNG